MCVCVCVCPQWLESVVTFAVSRSVRNRKAKVIQVRCGKRQDTVSDKRGIIGSAEALPILCVRYIRWERERERERYRERERDGSDVIIVALKLAMNLHFPFAKIRTIGDEFTLSLAKDSHFSFIPFTLPVSPFTERSPLWRWNSQWVHTFRCQKNFRLLCSHSFKWCEPRDEWSKTQDKRSNPAQSYIVLPIEKLNQINTKSYWK